MSSPGAVPTMAPTRDHAPVRPVLEPAAQAFAEATAAPPYRYDLPPEEGRTTACAYLFAALHRDPGPTAASS